MVASTRIFIGARRTPNWSVLRTGYHLCENGDLERREGSLVYVMVRQQSNRALPIRESSYG